MESVRLSEALAVTLRPDKAQTTYEEIRAMVMERLNLVPERLTLNEAAEVILNLQPGVVFHRRMVMMMMWVYGVVASRVVRVPGESTMQNLAEKTGVDQRTLYECVRCIEVFDNDFSAYMSFVTRGKPTWTRIQGYIRKKQGPRKRVSRSRGKARRLEAKTEKKATAKMLPIVPIEVTETGEAIREEALTVAMDRPIDRPEDAPENEAYWVFVASLPCCVTGEKQAKPYHLELKPSGDPGSVYSLLPLSEAASDYLVGKGRKAFESRYGVRIEKLVLDTLHVFLTGRRLRW